MWRRESESMIMSDKKDQNNLVTLGPAIIYSYGPARQSVPVFGLRNGANTCVKPGLRDHCVWTDWKLVGLGCSLLYIRFGRSVHASMSLRVPAKRWACACRLHRQMFRCGERERESCAARLHCSQSSFVLLMLPRAGVRSFPPSRLPV